ncbi:MAG: 4'-phosphopantetheinyl transferase superfamily protein [Coxiellaceae bacterium]|jgi:4'-phosphopantetheinyl transferase|nr:4'-phosphopantetheinyl transferase superfamily protein [Coxiellaceae bacterium]
MIWQISEEFLQLRVNEVHIWRASLNHSRKKILDFLKILNLQEQVRATKFMMRKAASNFIVSRGILRILLSRYLCVDQRQIVFHQNPYGKLYFPAMNLHFNLSHSNEMALFIFSLNGPVGIDVEFIRTDYNFINLAKKFFSKLENEKLFALPKDEQLLAFYNCWTRKEAVIKARGIGIFREFNKFSVEVSPDKEGKKQLFFDQNDQNLTLEAIDPEKSYAGAFVTSLSKFKVSFYSFL